MSGYFPAHQRSAPHRLPDRGQRPVARPAALTRLMLASAGSHGRPFGAASGLQLQRDGALHRQISHRRIQPGPQQVQIHPSVVLDQFDTHHLRAFSKTVDAAFRSWGLVLYAIGADRPLQQSVPPNVLLISLSDLLRDMQHRSFATVVRDLRNARVHGGNS